MELNFFLLILGVGMVFWGKKLFWLFISAAGFLFGLSTSQSLMPNEAIWFYLIVAAICGGIAVVLVKLLKNVAFGVGGFVLGAYLADGVLQMMDLNLGTASWVVIILAGAAGAALMLLLFNWALIILISLCRLPPDHPRHSRRSARFTDSIHWDQLCWDSLPKPEKALRTGQFLFRQRYFPKLPTEPG